MPSFTLYLTAAALAASVTAAPAVSKGSPHSPRRLQGLKKRAVSQDVYDNLNLYSQFSAAAYCEASNNSTGTKLTCDSGNCPLVEADDTETLLEFQNTALTDATGYVARDDTRSEIIVAFRGTESIRNWFDDADFVAVLTDICDGCTAFQGIYNSWLESRDNILAAVKEANSANPDYSIVVTGHSLGGGIADFCAAELRSDDYDVALYTYGAPRIGGTAISDYITNQAGGNFRVTHSDDPVPQLPPVALGYVHISPEYYITTGNGVAVTAEDIDVYEGDVNTGGNTGNWSLDVDAHTWYFGPISECYNGTFEF